MRSPRLVTRETRMIVINCPHNPTGSILTADDMREPSRGIAIEHDLVVLADEIYGRLQYEGEPLSIATLPGMAERTITLDGFSQDLRHDRLAARLRHRPRPGCSRPSAAW